jgi:major membrane immunogen (membrane-anchored lipoprotein)
LLNAKRLPIAVVLTILISTWIVLIACSSSSDTPASVVNGTPTSAPTPKPFKVGDHVKVGFWVVTINSIKTSTGDDFDQPKGIYLIIDASYQNTDNQSHTISSLIQFTLQDSTGQKYDTAIAALDGVTQPDGDVQPGKTTRGQTVYDVPKNIKSFEFTFEEPFSNSAAIWDLTLS